MTFEFDDVMAHAKRIVDVQRNVAAEAFPKGGLLRCRRCGHEQRFSVGDAARYTATGWPRCHQTMELVEAP